MPRGRGSPQGCGGRSRQAGVVGPTSKDRTDPKGLWSLQGIWVGPGTSYTHLVFFPHF